MAIAVEQVKKPDWATRIAVTLMLGLVAFCVFAVLGVADQNRRARTQRYTITATAVGGETMKLWEHAHHVIQDRTSISFTDADGRRWTINGSFITVEE